MAGKKSGKGGVNIPVSTDAKEAKNEIKSLNEEVKTVEKNTKNLSKTTKKALDDFTKDIKKLNAAFASGKKVITKEGFLDKRFLNKNLRSPEGLKKLSQSEGLAPELYIATLKEINKELSENSQKQKQITNQIKERRDIEVAANKQKKEDTLALKKVELEYWTQARIAVLDKQKANQIEKEQRAQARKEADRQRREEEKRAKEEAKAAEIEANRFITDKKLYQVTEIEAKKLGNIVIVK